MKDEGRAKNFSLFIFHPSAFIRAAQQRILRHIHPLLKWLRRLLTTPAGRLRWEFWLWFALSLAFALAYALAGGLRVARRGQYRLVFRIDEAKRLIVVRRVDHRRDVYRPR